MTPHEQKAQECARQIHPEYDNGWFMTIPVERRPNYVAMLEKANERRDYLAAIILRHFPEPKEKVCRWVPIGDGVFKAHDKVTFTLCGQTHCHYCGGKIV